MAQYDCLDALSSLGFSGLDCMPADRTARGPAPEAVFDAPEKTYLILFGQTDSLDSGLGIVVICPGSKKSDPRSDPRFTDPEKT